MKVIDISRDLLNTEPYPGDPAPQVQTLHSPAYGDIYTTSALYTCLHTGTHLDAPAHFLEDGDFISDIPLEKFTGNVSVITLPAGPITGDIVERLFPRYVKKIILRTQPDNVFFGGAADDVAALGYDLIGYDAMSLGGENESGFHRAILKAGTVLLENLDLSEVPGDGVYYLVAMPLKLSGLEASPCRAVLLENDKGFG